MKFKKGKDDWHINDGILHDAVKAIHKSVKVDTKHDVPYVAGYDKDKHIVYIDDKQPLIAEFDGKKVDIEKYLVLHEVIEKSLINYSNLKYQHAHQIALRMEREAVENDGLDWEEYNNFFEKWIKVIGKEKIDNPPATLDLTPYKDEHDEKLLKNLKEAHVCSRCSDMALLRELVNKK